MYDYADKIKTNLLNIKVFVSGKGKKEAVAGEQSKSLKIEG